jgi:hypothetical protein
MIGFRQIEFFDHTGQLLFWDGNGKSVPIRYSGEDLVTDATVARGLVAVAFGNQVQVLDCQTREQKSRFTVQRSVRGLRFCGSRQLLAAITQGPASEHNAVTLILDFEAERELMRVFHEPLSGPIWSRFSDDGTRLAFGGNDLAYVVGLESISSPPWDLPHAVAQQVAFADDGQRIAAVFEERGTTKLIIGDVETGRILSEAKLPPQYYIQQLRFSPNRQQILLAGDRVLHGSVSGVAELGTLIREQIAISETELPFVHRKGLVRFAETTGRPEVHGPNGSWMWPDTGGLQPTDVVRDSGLGDTTVQAVGYDRVRQEALRYTTAQDSANWFCVRPHHWTPLETAGGQLPLDVEEASFSPTGTYLAAALADTRAEEGQPRTLHLSLWNTNTGKLLSHRLLNEVEDLVADAERPPRLRFSADERWLGYRGVKRIVLYALPGGQESMALAPEDDKYPIVFSPSGRYVALVRDEKIARIYDAQMQGKVRTVTLPVPINQIVFSPDERFIAVATKAGLQVRLWQELDLIRAARRVVQASSPR